MLGNWRSHFDYRKFLLSNLKNTYKINPTIVEYYSSSIEKLYNLNLDDIKPLVSKAYSLTDKFSENSSIGELALLYHF